MDKIRSTIKFNDVLVDGVFRNETYEFIDFDWSIDNTREYYIFDEHTRTITSLGIYDNYEQGPEFSYSDEFQGRLLIKFY
jgi:hypothetical protein